jgi:hypothetical protein
MNDGDMSYRHKVYLYTLIERKNNFYRPKVVISLLLAEIQYCILTSAKVGFFCLAHDLICMQFADFMCGMLDSAN